VGWIAHTGWLKEKGGPAPGWGMLGEDLVAWRIEGNS